MNCVNNNEITSKSLVIKLQDIPDYQNNKEKNIHCSELMFMDNYYFYISIIFILRLSRRHATFISKLHKDKRYFY
jgi:hypothetical protein